MLTLRRILHPTDYSSHSEVALRLAGSLARDHGAELVLAYIEEPPTAIATEGMMFSPTPVDLDAVRDRLNQVRVDDPMIAVQRVLVEGDPAAEILELARNMNCDLIVMGTHGRTGLQRMLMGSVAEQVVRKATCPVLTVKCPPAPAKVVEANDVAHVAIR